MRVSIAALLTAAALGGAALIAHRRLVLVSVTGTSMEPTLRHGDRILVRRRRPADVRRGDIAVLAAPDAAQGPEWHCLGWHVKRVVALPGDQVPPGVPAPDATGHVREGTVVVFGDNPMGGDSRQWGPYDVDGLVGTYLCRTRKGGEAA